MVRPSGASNWSKPETDHLLDILESCYRSMDNTNERWPGIIARMIKVTTMMKTMTTRITSYALSLSGRKAADEAFYDLFGYPYHHQQQQLSEGGSIITDNDQRMQQQKDPITSTTTNKNNLNRRAIHILSTIFGKRSTSTLLSNSKFNAKSARPKDRALSGGMIQLERRVIHETKPFAGREIKVEKVVLVPVFANEVANNTTSTITNAATIDTSDGTSVNDARTTASNPITSATTTITTTTRGLRKKEDSTISSPKYPVQTNYLPCLKLPPIGICSKVPMSILPRNWRTQPGGMRHIW